jgi:predicted SnoaL-like aldol condensation-catalyzing enzyme/uncharacterized protein YndB with AHSA1/START domain
VYDHVTWPYQYDPRRSAIYSLNDVDVKAPAEVVWKLLVDAKNWSRYFPAEDQVRILTGEPGLALGTKYSRVTVGFLMNLIVTEYDPGRRLSWSTVVDGDETGSTAYHGWVVTPTDDGCHVLSEETQQGPFFLEEIGRKHPGALYGYHQEWAESLARAAEAEAANATGEIEKVLAVFRGTGAGDAYLATKYMNPNKYVQHNPHVADGIDGVKEYIGQRPRENHHSKVVRAFQDGPYVFTHGEGLILGQSVFFHIFRFEDGLIVEHWVFSARGAPPNKSGHTQTDGPTQALLSEDTEKNKSIVREYYETIHVSGDHSKLPQYFAGDHCIRHEPGVRDGVAAFKRDLEELVKHRSIDEIKFVLGQGDFVFIAAKGSHKGDACVYIDLYRVEDQKIAERWGFPEEIPLRNEWKNGNGML